MAKLIKYENFFILFSVLPFSYLANLRLPHIFNSFSIITAFINSMMIVVFTLFRYRPTDVTVRLSDWVFALLANGSSFLPFFFGAPGLQVISFTQASVISLLSLVLMLLARFHIGRNIGFVPAKRNQIVVSSVYKWVRHPIYTAVALNTLSWLLSRLSFVNFSISATIVLLFCITAYCEEQYLLKFPDYVEYTKKVKYRFIPFVI